MCCLVGELLLARLHELVLVQPPQSQSQFGGEEAHAKLGWLVKPGRGCDWRGSLERWRVVVVGNHRRRVAAKISDSPGNVSSSAHRGGLDIGVQLMSVELTFSLTN